MHAQIFRQRGILRRHRFIHGIGHIAVGEVAGGAGPQFGDVNHLGKIHLEQGALAEAQRNRVLRIFPRFGSACRSQLLDRARGALHHRVVVFPGARGSSSSRRVVSVFGGELLPDLDAAAVAVHVAEAADIHQDVEAELLSGAERPQHLVMAAAMAQPEVDDLAANAVRPRPAPPGESAGRNNG